MKIYLDRRLGDVHDLVSFSETLVCAQEYYPDAVDYRPDARLPVDFRRLDELEVEKYTASLDELSIDDELDFVAIFPCDLESERVLDFSPFFSLSPVAALDPSIDDGHRPSITVDRESGLRLGLHLDSWDGLDVSSRWKSRNRIVVNRGPADRYVYLVPVPIEEMAESIASSEGLHAGEVADAYIRNARQGPCLRMLQSANVAYVCCTERLVHDACVRAGGNRAESRHYLGHFVRN
ncbi:MAG: hypothetical protein F4X96_03955 [Gammaproteobacteria bacterium]|nr:hypothetical protein [Gammaproteobacteria bacterium]